MPPFLITSRNQHRLVLLLAWSIVTGILLLPRVAEARFISFLSLATGEVYSDNIFFDERNEHDFVTMVTPTLSLVYQTSLATPPLFSVNLSPSAQIFANHSELNNFGEDLGFDTSYIYPYSPRLDFALSERFKRRGESRIGGLEGFGGSGGSGGLGGGEGSGRLGGRGRSSGVFSNKGDLLSQGDRLENEFKARGQFLYTPNMTFEGEYSWDYTNFLDQGGNETEHTLAIEGTYSRWRQHNLRVRYEITLLKSRNGESNVLHDIEIGDSFFSSREIQLTPTLTIFASTGIALRTGNDFRIDNRTNLHVRKIWRTASLEVGVDRDLTSSEGVSGPSFTTSFFGSFTLQLTRRLSVLAGTEFSLFDTAGEDFKTFQAFAGLRYWLTSWLSTGFAYSYQWLDSDGGSGRTSFFEQSAVDSNSISVFLAAYFDIWPNIGLAKSRSASPLSASRGRFMRFPQRRGP